MRACLCFCWTKHVLSFLIYNKNKINNYGRAQISIPQLFYLLHLLKTDSFHKLSPPFFLKNVKMRLVTNMRYALKRQYNVDCRTSWCNLVECCESHWSNSNLQTFRCKIFKKRKCWQGRTGYREHTLESLLRKSFCLSPIMPATNLCSWFNPTTRIPNSYYYKNYR